MAQPNKLADAAGNPVVLGRELGHGGEASVYQVANIPETVAKVYHRLVTPDKAAKLVEMPKLASHRLRSFVAWPSSTLHGGRNGPIIGFIMPKAEGFAEVHRLYNPRQRLTEYPTVDWSGLVRVAHNVAASFDAVHAEGHVIGDVNQGNVVVSTNGLVRLIDCDSFQVRGTDRWYLCDVGVGHFTPPELQGLGSFEGLVRTQQHDAFGLSLLIFHLLFLGRHPFIGLYPGKDVLLEEAIKEHRFAFGARATAQNISPPPHSLRLADASLAVATLFERAFSPEAARSGEGRPTAAGWIAALKSLESEIRSCNAVKRHKYHQSLSNCPWCAIEAKGGPNFFLGAVFAARGTTFDLEGVLREISDLTAPEASLPDATTGFAVRAPTPIDRWTRTKAAGVKVSHTLAILSIVRFVTAPQEPSFIAMIIMIVLGLALSSLNTLPQEKKRRDAALQVANAALTSAERRLTSHITGIRSQFQEQRAAAERMRAEYLDFNQAQARTMEHLRNDRRRQQLQRHLERYYISLAQLRGIGPSLIAALQSFGIETAADITRNGVLQVPGIGEIKANTLLQWQAGCAAAFVFDPSRAVDPSEIQLVEAAFAKRRAELQAALRATPHHMRRAIAQVDQARRGALPELQRLSTAARAAKADVMII